MLKLSTKTQYGLRAIVYLAKNKSKFCSLKEISDAEEISFDYLEKIMSKLKKASFLKSKKGVLGGYQLKKNPKAIKAGDLVKILEGDLALVKCAGAVGVCDKEKNCLTRALWQKTQKAISQALDSLTLADLVK